MVNKKQVGLGAGALAGVAAAAAAGYYFFASSDAKHHRKIASKWAGGLKKDVVMEAKKIQKLDRKQLLKIVDKAAAAYETVRTVDSKELMKAAKELKNNWKDIAVEVGMGTGAKKTTAKISAKRAPAKSAKKAKPKTTKSAK